CRCPPRARRARKRPGYGPAYGSLRAWGVCPRQTAPGQAPGQLRISIRSAGNVFCNRRLQHGLELAGLEQIDDDVRTTDQFTIDIKLRDGRPVGVVLDALAVDFLVFEHIDGLELDAAGLECFRAACRKTALREVGSAL